MAQIQTKDHEMVSIYPFTDEEVDQMMTHSGECVLMWATKDGWPVGVTHAYVWRDGKVWLTFASHRHRAAAIRRDPRVSVNVSSAAYRPDAAEDLPRGAITIKGTGEFFEDDDTKAWFYRALAKKVRPDSKQEEEAFFNLLNSPLRTILAITPVKKIMYNAGLAGRHMAGTVEESELGEPLSGDRERMNAERAKRGLPPR
ncbi:MAG: pyridoxamine 5'-phosphate oxidase family protein [Gammaproteobacteria bacterium]|jgi:nitroimidazol reductase NimA-like FMN-containing flavoprotein (pyridoxamine 5'-phosphate oxidase superfamily)|nr:pyridoxamine 5'-phosphate oxidase family protein [Gammaproteobacteria bacterium]